MNRRDMLAGLGAGLALTTFATRADAQTRTGDLKAPAKPNAKGASRTALLASLSTCLAKATHCDAHCTQQLAAGDKTFVRCSSAVRDMIAIAQTAANIVSRNTVLAKRTVELCLAACKECIAACLEHKAHFAHGMHIECKECMEACEACAKACDAYLAA